MSTPEFILREQEGEIRDRLVARRTIMQKDARVAVPVTLLVSTAPLDASEFDRRIRRALKRFVDSVRVFSRIRRDGEAVGDERGMLTARGRVPHREVFNLNERAQRASGGGLYRGEDHALSLQARPRQQGPGVTGAERIGIVAEAGPPRPPSRRAARMLANSRARGRTARGCRRRSLS